jgi:hypothetical protein
VAHRFVDYAKRARRRFCAGIHGTAPADLVLSGRRTLEEWVEVLHQERERTERRHLKLPPVMTRDNLEENKRFS